jgi:hypothetical protein
MGLDITVYSKVKLAAVQGVDANREPLSDEDFAESLYVDKNFPSACPEFHNGTVVTHDGECQHFRAGSYGGYNEWRDKLAKLAGYASAASVWRNPEPGPFVELINFSDCEGTIGPSVCAKLAKDFAEFQPKVDALPDSFDASYFRERYADWRAAFELAAGNGIVVFH